jgi:peptidyl-dipeptidase A
MGDAGVGGADAIVEALSARLQPLERAANEAWWLASTEVSEVHERRRVAADVALRGALGDVAAYAQVRDALASSPGADAPRRRELEVLRDRLLPHQVPADIRAELAEVEAALDATFNSFRGTIDGAAVSDNDIVAILRGSDDPEARRRAWEASKQVGAAVADRVRHLARLRNRAARHLGARDHFALALATTELDEDRLLATLDAIDAATATPFATWKAALDTDLARRFGTTVDDLAPWHYDDPFFQEPPVAGAIEIDAWFAGADLDALTLRTYAGLGLDVQPVLDRSDLLPRDGKSQHAFCIDVDKAGDVRVLCNNVANEYWAETMLHEFGHAVYDVYVDTDLPWLLHDMHPLATEGIAMLFGRLVRDPEWLTAVAGVPSTEVQALAGALARARRAKLLVFARWVLVMTHFERRLYADPDQDLDAVWWELVGRYQGVRRPEGRARGDWAAKLHVALAPVYYQNYLYGELFASQLQATLERETGGLVGRPDAGAFLVDRVFAPGLSRRWDQLIEDATGAPLGVDALAAELAALDV